MASSISNSFPVWKTIKICLAGSLWWQTIDVAKADLSATAKPSLKKKSAQSGSTLPTAIAESASAEVNRAGEVTVRLRGISAGGGQIEFMLMRKPEHGRIIRSKPVGLDSLDVTYRQSGNQRTDTDSFVFAVRAGRSGPFSPGEVKIAVKDQPGRLLVPEELPFPAVFVGKTATDSFVVINQGGETLKGKVNASPPWQLQNPSEYNLKPGEKQKISVMFNPEKNGPVEGRITFEGSKPASVQLRGEGIAPFLTSPTTVKLTPGPDGKRSGMVTIQNNTDGMVTVEVDSKLILPKTVVLQFGEIREIPVEDTGTGELNTAIQFKRESFETRVDITASNIAAQ